MNAPPWLRELHRQWHAVRGGRLEPSKRAFALDWQDLLKAAGLRADEHAVAGREAEALEKEGRLVLRRHKYRRYIIEEVGIPPSAEDWFREKFGSTSGSLLLRRASESVERWKRQSHPRWPESWQRLCEVLETAFAKGSVVRPFRWRAPSEVEWLLAALHALTSREWPEGKLVRGASQELGWETKTLEQRRRVIEAGLALLFEKVTPLESLGLVCTQSRVFVQGPLTLHFEDGAVQDVSHLHGGTSLSQLDLARAARVSTTAHRLLSVENFKETFHQAIVANRAGDTLLLATSYPTAATLQLLKLLPESLPHFHFGDTDASGYAILRHLRRQSPRPVAAFLMGWEDQAGSASLSERDLSLLPGLIASEEMGDCRDDLERMQASGRKGAFEQERFGMPELKGWPFWSAAEHCRPEARDS